MAVCPRCGEPTATGQEYCVECGLRLPGPGPVGISPSGRSWVKRALLAFVVAAAGAAAAVAAAGDGNSGATDVLTATGGFATIPRTDTVATPGEVGSTGVGAWPAQRSGWTIALLSLPQTRGRKPAVAEVRRARRAGLPTVGILDSSAYASLHPGYWIVFSGVYTSQAEATSALQSAREFTRSASVRNVVP